MSDRPNDSSSAGAGSGPPPDAQPLDPPVPGRGQSRVEVGLRRLEGSIVLKSCAVTAFLCYGGLIAVMLAGKLTFANAGVVASMSLASWFFLFWWFPVIERTIEILGGDPRRRAIGRALETIGIGCVVLVHVLLAIIVVHAARS